MIVRFIILYGTMLTISQIDARVFCGDPNAGNMTYLGYSCPLKCANVIAVVEQLKIVDYHRLLTEGEDERIIIGPYEPLFSKSKLRIGPYYGRSKPDRKRDFLSLLQSKAEKKARFGDYIRVLSSNTTMKYLQKELYHYAFIKKHNITFCLRENDTSNNNEEQMKSYHSVCTRRSEYEDAFIKRLTKFLNEHANVKYHFTKPMVVALLRKILGSNMDMYESEKVVPKIMSYLRDAMRTTTDIEPTIVHLAPRHCLGIYVPGCFCNNGFVERFGKCISLKTCLKEANKDLSGYINRVIVH